MDRALEILQKLKIDPVDNWTTIHMYKKDGLKDICYYYTFEINEATYCLSADSISYVLSVNDGFNQLYAGLDDKKVIKILKKLLKKKVKK